ncbi:uncharacterized protein LOC131044654 isoform X1 [Cryptomeria japonica]|uniref:uncharacterized protein LOC131044654 isoform X1 n=1 Tax=Cryptomeria japonica TaxID=3369 RepID=UPI0025AD72E7|nr:uncharacterized protein LOC131044654 isoform X1 [Cryptomeria japonica]
MQRCLHGQGQLSQLPCFPFRPHFFFSLLDLRRDLENAANAWELVTMRIVHRGAIREVFNLCRQGKTTMYTMCRQGNNKQVKVDAIARSYSGTKSSTGVKYLFVWKELVIFLRKIDKPSLK